MRARFPLECYQPPAAAPRPESRASFVDALFAGALTADELLRHYCTLVYARTRNYLDTARRLGIDRRTVRAKVDPGLLEQLCRDSTPASDA